MTEPAALPTATAPKRSARWIDLATGIVLLGGVVAALVAGAPALLRATGVLVEPPATYFPPQPTTRPTATAHAAPRSSTYAYDDHPRFAPDDEPPRVTELERMYPEEAWPGRHGKPNEPDREPRVDVGPATKAKTGRTRGPVTIREIGEAGATVTGHVPADEAVMVVREQKGWALVVYKGKTEVVIGWAPRNLITIP